MIGIILLFYIIMYIDQCSDPHFDSIFEKIGLVILFANSGAVPTLLGYSNSMPIITFHAKLFGDEDA